MTTYTVYANVEQQGSTKVSRHRTLIGAGNSFLDGDARYPRGVIDGNGNNVTEAATKAVFDAIDYQVERPDMTPAEVKAIRKRAGLSQTGLAALLRISDARTVRHWEHGTRGVSGPVTILLELIASGAWR